MPSFRFLHCADLHIDSPLRGLEADSDAPLARVRGATREAFTALVDYAIAQKVDFVLAAGDLYDGNWQDWRTGQFLIQQVGRLSQHGIPFIAISGNHDAASVLTNDLSLPQPARKLTVSRPETVEIPHLNVRIHGQGFATRAVTENLAANYPAAQPDRFFDIGLLHTLVDGHEGHERYAPTSLDQLRHTGYRYWALGHVHTRQVLHQDPWIVYPGNIQGRHARETGPKGATLVTVRDNRVIDPPEPLTFDTVRWAQVKVDVCDATDEEAVLTKARAALVSALDAADSRLVAARIILIGDCPAHALLHRDPGAVREKIRAEGIGLAGPDRIWTESVVLATTPPRDRASLADSAGAMGTLLAAVESPDHAALNEAARKYCQDMLNRAPFLREELPEDHPAIRAAQGSIPPDLLERARALLLARLDEG